MVGDQSNRLKEVLEWMEKDDPHLWRVCYPRIYEEPRCGQYYSPKNVARQLLGVAIKVSEGLVGSSEHAEFVACSHLAKFRVPMFWLSPDIMTAIRRTTPPQDIEWYEMPLPFEACVFMVPKDTLKHPTNGDVVFIAYSRFKKSEIHNSLLVPGQQYGSRNGGMTFLALTRGHTKEGIDGYCIHWNLPLDAFGPTIRVPDLDNYVDRYVDEEHDSPFGNPKMSYDDNHLMAEVGHYVLGALLLMQARPDLVTHERLQKRVVKSGKAPREYWSPNILGEHYRLPTPQQGGSHASPRLHWVRGHYRDQPVGEKRGGQRKLIWIEPFTRGD